MARKRQRLDGSSPGARAPAKPSVPEDSGARAGAEQRRRQAGARPEDRAESFYAELFTPEELADLARTEAEPSLEDEINLLRVAIRRGMANGEKLETVSRSVQRLAQALKVQRGLQGQGIRNLEEALARVLDEIVSEMGTR